MTPDWVEIFLTSALDCEHELSAGYFKRKKWNARVVAGYMNPLLAEWIVAATSHFGDDLIGLAFEYKRPGEITGVEKNADSLMRYYYDTSHCYSILTNAREEFVVYKDEANRFLVIAGAQEFLAKAYKCSADAAEKMFAWEVDGDFEEDDMRRVWKKYMGKDLRIGLW